VTGEYRATIQVSSPISTTTAAVAFGYGTAALSHISPFLPLSLSLSFFAPGNMMECMAASEVREKAPIGNVDFAEGAAAAAAT
jgi:hypothetical protein